MVDHGSKLLAAPVEGWYDCGKPNTLLETNQHLLETTRGWVAPDARMEGSTLVEPVRIEEGVTLVGSTVGPNVTVEAGARILNSTLRNCIVGPGTVMEDSAVEESLVGGNATIKGYRGRLNVMDHSEVG
jgi:glucose-1-phosphate thymidylyltransferase